MWWYNLKNAKITKRAHAFKGYANSYNVEILSSFNPELQLKEIESAFKSKLIESEDKAKYDFYSFYSSSKAEIIINKSDTDDAFQSVYITIISNIISKGSAGFLV